MKYYIFGAGGHSKVVLDAMIELNLSCNGFLDISSKIEHCGLQVLNPLSQDLINMTNTSFHIAIGSCKLREELSKDNKNLSFFSISHPKTTISSTASILEGCFLASGSIIAADSSIGRHCIINHNAIIDHECIVGDFSNISPGAVLGGNVKVGRGVHIGLGAIILPGLVIEDYATVGAGALVTGNVKSFTTVFGSPAKEVYRKNT